MYLVYHGYMINDMLIDCLKLDIKNDYDLKEYLSSIEKLVLIE